MRLFVIVFLLMSLCPHAALLAADSPGSQRSITDRSISIPEWKDWKRVFF